MINRYWLEQEEKFLNAINYVDVPNNPLDKVDNLFQKWN
jgi:hypothetical protein